MHLTSLINAAIEVLDCLVWVHILVKDGHPNSARALLSRVARGRSGHSRFPRELYTALPDGGYNLDELPQCKNKYQLTFHSENGELKSITHKQLSTELT